MKSLLDYSPIYVHSIKLSSIASNRGEKKEKYRRDALPAQSKIKCLLYSNGDCKHIMCSKNYSNPNEWPSKWWRWWQNLVYFSIIYYCRCSRISKSITWSELNVHMHKLLRSKEQCAWWKGIKRLQQPCRCQIKHHILLRQILNSYSIWFGAMPKKHWIIFVISSGNATAAAITLQPPLLLLFLSPHQSGLKWKFIHF